MKVRSDGGSTSYYELPAWATELRHLMEHKEMTPDQANIFKAAYRLGEKEGNSLEYDLNKIIFFATCIKERIIREKPVGEYSVKPIVKPIVKADSGGVYGDWFDSAKPPDN